MPLENEVAAIQTALAAITHPPVAIKRAESLHRTLDRKLKEHAAQPESAVAAYNLARRQLVIDAAIARGQGFCSIGKHLADLDELEGLIVTGAYVSSGYYESLHSYEDRESACRKCRLGLRSSTGRYEGEYRKYHSFELKDPADTFHQIKGGSGYEFEQLAKKSGVELPPEAHYDRFKGVTIGSTTIKLDWPE